MIKTGCTLLDTELKRINEEIFAVEQERGNMEIELSNVPKYSNRSRGRNCRSGLHFWIKNEKMKDEISKVLRDARYANAAEFLL